MLNELEYVELGLFCADICRALERGMGGKKLGDLSQSVCDAINQLTKWVGPTILRLRVLSTMPPIAGPSRRYRTRSSNRADEMESPDFGMQGMIKKQFPAGSWSSTGSLLSSMCVLWPLFGRR